jgi:hypothetical protein
MKSIVVTLETIDMFGRRLFVGFKRNHRGVLAIGREPLLHNFSTHRMGQHIWAQVGFDSKEKKEHEVKV